MPKTNESPPADAYGGYVRNPRHWTEYTTVEDWYRDFHGRVPVDTALAIRRLIKTTGMTFPEAYRALLDGRVIIVVNEELGGEPRSPDGPSAAASDKETTGES